MNSSIESTSATKIADEESKRPSMGDIVLNTPKPPALWDEISVSIKEEVFPRRSGPFSLLTWILSAVQGLFPVLQWGRSYSFKYFRSDFMAGLTLASLGIPQSIGYANLAKLDPQYGLYTSVVPPLIYSVMGTSRDIAIGPVAVVSLLLSSMVQKVVDPTADPIAYRKLVFTATLLSRLGFLVDFLSHAAIVGFMAGAAIVIGLQQLKGLLGINHFTNETDVVSVIKAVWWHYGNFLIGCAFLIFILATYGAWQKSPLASLLSFVFYNCAGSFSRTAVNFSAGCKTTVSNIVMAVTVFIALQLLTRLLYYTPVTILASIILSALPGLIDVKEVCNIWEIDKMDFLTCMGAFLGVLFGSVEIGLSAAVIISFAKIIIRSIRPHIEMLGRIQGTDIFCSIRQYPTAAQAPGVLLIRIDSSFLCFMNANFIRERITRWVMEECDPNEKKPGEKSHSVVVDMSNVMNIDTSGTAALGEMHKELLFLGIQFAIANPGWQAIHKMKRAGLVECIGGEWIFLTVDEAVKACLAAKDVSCA